jgi:hypothetical protein
MEEGIVKLYSILKFGKENRIVDLYRNGKLFIQSIQNLKKDSSSFRGDSYEGAIEARSYYPGKALLDVEEKTIDFNHHGITLRKSYEYTLGNVLSLYAVSDLNFTNGKELIIDPRMQEFGTHYLLIRDVSKFFELIKKELTRLNYNYWDGFVNYFNEKEYTGDLNLFQKRMQYEYQCEYRIYIDSGQLEGITLNLGSLKDISIICDASDLSQIKTCELNSEI